MTHEYQGDVEVLVVFLDIVRIVFGGLPLVRRVEVGAGIIGLGGLEERSENILEVTCSQRSGTNERGAQNVPLGSICSGGDTFSLFQHHP